MCEAVPLDRVLVATHRVASEPDLALDPLAVRLTGRNGGRLRSRRCRGSPAAGTLSRESAPSDPGGQGGGVCDASGSEPVAGVEDFAYCAYRRMVLRSTPVRRSISRWLTPCPSSVSMVVRRCGFKTFTPSLPGSGWGGVYVPLQGTYSKVPLIRLVEDFGVATGGGVWAAAGVQIHQQTRILLQGTLATSTGTTRTTGLRCCARLQLAKTALDRGTRNPRRTLDQPYPSVTQRLRLGRRPQSSRPLRQLGLQAFVLLAQELEVHEPQDTTGGARESITYFFTNPNQQGSRTLTRQPSTPRPYFSRSMAVRSCWGTLPA